MAVERPNMSETGPEITPTEVQVPIEKGISPEAHQRREDYLVQKEGHEIIVRDPKLVDPNTGENQIIRKMPEVAGGNGFTPEEDAILNRIFDAEQRKRLEANASPGRIRELINSWKSSQTEQRVNPEQQPNQTTAMPDGEGENEGPPEGPRPPEVNDKEWETSPERGRWLVDEITRLRTTMPYQERYAILDKEGRPYLKQLYKDLQNYVNAICKVRNERDPWDPKKIYKEIQEAQKDNPEAAKSGPNGEPPKESSGQPGSSEQSAISQRVNRPEQGSSRSAADNEHLKDKTKEQCQQEIAGLYVAYENIDTPEDQLPEIEKRLLIYFREAHRKGLLQGADEILRSIYQEHIQTGELSVNQVMQLVEQGIRQAAKDAEGLYKANRSDPEIVALKNIWIPYLSWAGQRLSNAVHNRQQPGYQDGEFRLEREATEIVDVLDQARETYWQPGSWAGYYIVTAKTPEQFRIAAETFFHLIRQGSIGKSPEDVFKHLQNFKEAFGAAGSKQIDIQRNLKKEDRLTHKFLRELRQEFEAKSYIFLADYSNETYNSKTYNQGMMALALHEGPDRIVRLARAGEGQIATYADIFGEESPDTLMAIFHNPVGEQGELDIIAQHYVQDQTRQRIIEKGMGIQLKDYDPREDSTNLANYEQYKNQDINKLPAALKRSIELGRIQSELRSGKKVSRLSDDDQKVYLAFLTKSRSIEQKTKNRERIGFHMPREDSNALYEGTDGISAHVRNYQSFGDLNAEILNKLPFSLRRSIELGRIQIQLNDLRIKVRKGVIKLEPGQAITNLLSESDQDKYQAAFEQAEANFDIAFQMQGAMGEKVRKGRGFFYVDKNEHFLAYQGIQGKEDKKLSLSEKRKKWTNTQWMGFILNSLREGRKLGTFSREEQDFYKGLGTIDKDGKFKLASVGPDGKIIPTFTDEDRNDVVDSLPVYLAEDLVQYAITRAKIQYANHSASDRAKAVEKARVDAIKQIKLQGFEAKLILPKLKFDTNPNSPSFGEVIGTEAGTETIDLKTASESIYSRYTTHTYWGYQGENRHMLLTPHIFEAAKRIRAGISRPEDEDMLATQLLIADPTLKRVAKFATDQIEREITLLQAAVESSFQGFQKNRRDLYTDFLPETGNPGKMRTGYNMEDWGGTMRFAMGIRELMASQPARFTRRLGARIAYAPMEIDAMPAIWGQRGVLGAVNMFADQIKHIGHQGVVGQFGITKFIDQMDYGAEMFNLLVGSVDPQGKVHVEGLYMKPTNDNEKLHQFYTKEDGIFTKPHEQVPFLYEFKNTFGRLEKVMKLMRVMYSDVRNGGGALNLEKVDIFLPDGEFNSDIDEMKEVAMDTGTSRHSEKIFFDNFMEWLLSTERGGGVVAYPNERFWNSFLKAKRLVVLPGGVVQEADTFQDWLFDKLGL